MRRLPPGGCSGGSGEGVHHRNPGARCQGDGRQPAKDRRVLDGKLCCASESVWGLLADAYKTVNAQVKIADMRAAAEKHNPDGSIDVLVATRVAMSNNQQINQELSYRLRVRMVSDGGTYKIDNIEPVGK